MSAIDKNALVPMIESVLGKGQYEVYLFGSQATATATERSDIDIAIKASTPLDLAKWQELEGLFEESYLPYTVDVLDFHRVSEEFQTRILQSSIRLR